MEIKHLSREHCLDLVDIFRELDVYYFGEQAATKEELKKYLQQQVFSEHSGVNIVAVYEDTTVIGFATYTIMYPAPKLSGQLYMKELFVSSSARGQGVGLTLIKYLAKLAVNHHCWRMDWTAERTNPTAGEYYRSIGARLITEKEYYRFEGDALFHMADS